MADGHPKCNSSLDGNPADVMNADGSAELQAALAANEAQAGLDETEVPKDGIDKVQRTQCERHFMIC